ncbi:hypothetical protein LguiA_031361 [Lonicera macranthoides]
MSLAHLAQAQDSGIASFKMLSLPQDPEIAVEHQEFCIALHSRIYPLLWKM